MRPAVKRGSGLGFPIACWRHLMWGWKWSYFSTTSPVSCITLWMPSRYGEGGGRYDTASWWLGETLCKRTCRVEGAGRSCQGGDSALCRAYCRAGGRSSGNKHGTFHPYSVKLSPLLPARNERSKAAKRVCSERRNRISATPRVNLQHGR